MIKSNIIIQNSKYGIKENVTLRYIEVLVDDLEFEVYKLLLYLNDLTWINSLEIDWLKASFASRCKKTAEKISEEIKAVEKNSLAEEAGEYIVSTQSIYSVQHELHHKALPLLELIKEQVKGNPGFDFITINNTILMFGESKYRSNNNGYGAALEQIERFINDNKDLEELANIDKFITKINIDEFMNDHKGYIAGFSLHTNDEEKLIKNIIDNPHFKILCNYEEAIFIGVKLYE